MSDRFDVIVVGGGPAGSTAAYRLAAGGASVVVLDRARFPRDKPCGGGVTVRGARILPFSIESVVESVVDTVDVRMSWDRKFDITAPGPAVLMTQRRRLDHFLLQKAAEVGAVVREGVRVREIDSRPTGVTVRTDAGTISGSVLVGADGCNGVSRLAVNGSDGDRTYAVALEGNLPRDGRALPGFDTEQYTHRALLEFGTVPGGYGWIFPKGDHVNFGVGGWFEEGPRMRHYLAELCKVHGVDISQLRDVRGHRLPFRERESRFVKGRVLLVGDAAGLVDPFSGDGMYEAFLSSRAAAQTVLATLGGEASSLEAYESLVHRTLATHVASAWAGKLVIERFPRFGYWYVQRPKVRRRVHRRIRSNDKSPRGPMKTFIAAQIGAAARHALGPRAHGKPPLGGDSAG